MDSADETEKFSSEDSNAEEASHESLSCHSAPSPEFGPLPPANKLAPPIVQLGWSAVDEQVALAAHSLGLPKPLLPWEQGLAREVFSKKRKVQVDPFFQEPCLVGRSDFLLSALGSGHVKGPMPSLPVLPIAVRRIKLLQWKISEDDLALKCFGMIRIMLESDLNATSLGSVLHEKSRALDDEEHLRQILRDTFAKKSINTLYKRTLSFWAFFQHRVQQGYLNALWFNEGDLYEFLCSLRDKGRGATAGKSFLESLNFFHAMLGFKTMDGASMTTPRVLGVAHNMHTGKKPLAQAKPLTVQEVQGLEQIVLSDDHPHKRIIAGFLLFAMSTCSRFSDAQFAEQLELDEENGVCLIMAKTRVHKTATTAERKTALLPLIGFGQFFEDEPWARAWMDLRQEHDMGRFEFALPAYNESTFKWVERRMTTGEASLWLEEFLTSTSEGNGGAGSAKTHSLKCTILSWMAKSGRFAIEERRIAGHHLDAANVSALTYGRANFMPILLKLGRLLKDIRLGKFRPDVCFARAIAMELHQISEDDNELPSLEDDVSEIDDAETVEGSVRDLVPGPERRRVAFADPKQYEQHISSGTFHIIKNSDVFMCGRKRSSKYVAMEAAYVLDWPICTQCNGGCWARGRADVASRIVAQRRNWSSLRKRENQGCEFFFWLFFRMQSSNVSDAVQVEHLVLL